MSLSKAFCLACVEMWTWVTPSGRDSKWMYEPRASHGKNRQASCLSLRIYLRILILPYYTRAVPTRRLHCLTQTCLQHYDLHSSLHLVLALLKRNTLPKYRTLQWICLMTPALDSAGTSRSSKLDVYALVCADVSTEMRTTQVLSTDQFLNTKQVLTSLGTKP